MNRLYILSNQILAFISSCPKSIFPLIFCSYFSTLLLYRCRISHINIFNLEAGDSQSVEAKQVGSSRPKKQDKSKEQANVSKEQPISKAAPPTMATGTGSGDEIGAQIRTQGCSNILQIKTCKSYFLDVFNIYIFFRR